MEKVGKDGVITVEEGKGIRIETEFVEGMQLDRGYVSPYFVTNTDRMEAVIDDPYILITDKKISAVQDILPVLERVLQVTKNIVIVCDDVDGEALATLVVNKLRGTINVLAVKAPAFGDRRKAMLEDIAILTGGTFITEDIGPQARERRRSPTSAAPAASSRRKDDTVIIEGHGSDEAIQARIKQIKAQVEDATSEFDREKLQERLAKLAGGVAVIKVGAATEVELKEKQAPRRGRPLRHPRGRRRGHRPRRRRRPDPRPEGARQARQEAHRDEQTGVQILRKALEEPLRMIAENAGQEGLVVVDDVQDAKDPNYGYDAAEDVYGDMLKKGIIDPAKVTRTALENAASIAALVLTTESLVTEIPRRRRPCRWAARRRWTTRVRPHRLV